MRDVQPDAPAGAGCQPLRARERHAEEAPGTALTGYFLYAFKEGKKEIW